MDHPFGWLSLLPPITAIVLAIATKRIVFSLSIGILMGALVLKNWELIPAVQHMCKDHLWKQLTDPDTLHVFFFTMIMGVMVGMINRAAGMRGLVNVISPLASNRKRGQLTTWFLGLFVFFDDYANTMLLGNTLKPLTDKLKIAREKLAYLVDSTAAPVAGLALISTWVAGEIDYVNDGLSQLPETSDWKAFSLFLSSIPYRFYVLFALLFVPIVAILGRDFGPMLTAERKAVQGMLPAETDSDSQESNLANDPTAPSPETPARWFNAVIPVIVTVVAVIYFLYTSGKSDDTTTLRDIFGNADSYSSLLWGALWGAGSAYILIIAQRLLSFKELHQAGANGARLMMPALIVLWLAQSMSSMTKNDSIGGSHQPVVQALLASNAEPKAIVKYVATELELGDQEAAILVDSMKMIVADRHERYLAACDAHLESERAGGESSIESLRNSLAVFEKKERGTFEEATAEIFNAARSEESFTKFFVGMQLDEAGQTVHADRLEFATQFSRGGSVSYRRWQKSVADTEGSKAETGENSADLLSFEEANDFYPWINFEFLYRSGKLYSGDFLSERLASLKEGEGFIATNFVPMLPTMVFVLASIVAFSTGTSWGTMGIVMPLVIPLAYSQLSTGDTVVTEANPILLCCIGSVLAGAIFGDHCSPISDTTVLSSQASGCDHIAHVRTQLPYAVLVGLVSIVFGTLPIGYGVPVWLLLPIGIAAMVGALFLIGRKVE
jgi:Na+/H+ antiporter NhaC